MSYKRDIKVHVRPKPLLVKQINAHSTYYIEVDIYIELNFRTTKRQIV